MATSSDTCETEVNWLKKEIIPKLLKDQKLISDIAEIDLQNFHIINLTAQIIESSEAFMLTKCYRAQLTYEYNGVVGGIKLFVKKTPQLSKEIFDAVNFMALFNNEILAYERIIPTLERFGKFNLNTAKFYYGDLKSYSATIITEDFGKHNWTVSKDRFNLSLDHVIVAVKYLAQFHAAGFALRLKDKTQFEEITQGLIESRYTTGCDDPHWDLKIKTATQRTLRACREYQKDVNDIFLRKFDDLLKDPYQYCRQVVRPKEPFVTLCHGDYLRNNVAFRYGEGDDQQKPLDVMMFDLQTPTVSSPMLDFSIFLALSTFAEIRHKYFQEIFEAYCGQIKESYEKFTEQAVPEFLSFKPLLREYIRFLPYSIYTCSWFLLELVEPHGLSTDEHFNQMPSDDEIVRQALFRGGKVVDQELAHQMKELYELSKEYSVDIF